MKKKVKSFHGNLEIIVITYNRAKLLERTLSQFLKSPFRKCKITVLNNCSTDNTDNVCSKYIKLFPSFYIIRHKKNIGGGANYLRAAEIASAAYAWIICDDDIYDFSYCDDIIDVIEKESFDLISVGNATYKFTKRGIGSKIVELLKENEMYYTIHAFIPSLIFKTELFTSDCLIKGHLMQNDMFPQLYFVHSAAQGNFSIYISKNEILKDDLNNQAVNLNPFFQFSSWVRSCQIIENKKIKQRAIDEYFLNKRILFITKLMYYIYFEKVLLKQGRFNFGKEGLFKKFLILFEGFTGIQFLVLICLTPIFLAPSFIFKYFGKFVLWFYYKGEIPADKNPSAQIDPRD